MSLIPKEQLFVGLEISSSSIKIAAIKKRGKNWLFPILQEIPCDSQALAKILPKDAIIVSSLASHDVLIKNLQIPLKGEKEIKAAFDFQIEPLLPYPMEKSLATYIKVGEKDQNSLLTVFATKKEILKSHLEKFSQYSSLDIDYVTVKASALCAFSTTFSASEDPFFLVHIDSHEGTISLIEKGRLLASRSFEKEKSDLEKSLLALSSQYKSKQTDTLVLISEDPFWKEVLEKITGKPVNFPSFNDLPLSDENLQKYALCIGMAMSATTKNFPNFRQKEFQLLFPWKRLKKALFTFALCFIGLFSAATYLSSAFLKKKEEALLHRFSSLFPQHSVVNLDQLKEEMVAIEKKVNEIPDLFPLVPFVPKMIDFISWFSSHPIQAQNQITIEQLRYHMVKRPDFSKPHERYLVQVEMVFSSPQASFAEDIRLLLSSPNPFVDNKKEIEWSIDKGKYKAIFTLKDKTPYPS